MVEKKKGISTAVRRYAGVCKDLQKENAMPLCKAIHKFKTYKGIRTCISKSCKRKTLTGINTKSNIFTSGKIIQKKGKMIFIYTRIYNKEKQKNKTKKKQKQNEHDLQLYRDFCQKD